MNGLQKINMSKSMATVLTKLKAAVRVLIDRRGSLNIALDFYVWERVRLAH